MKISSLNLENFKSSPDGTIRLGKVNVLIGANGKGKTSTQNALRYVLNGKLPDDPIRHGEDHLRVSAVLDDATNTELERVLYLPDTYRINDEDVSQKVFLAETEKFRALCESNGYVPQVVKTGSNQFFVSQPEELLWGFLLTGKTDGARVRGIKELELEMYDGTTLYARKALPSRVSVNGKKTTGKAFAEFIRKRMNGDEKALDIVTSSAVMNAMEMQDFAKYLISVVPIKVDFKKLSALARLTPEEARVLEPLFPKAPEPITTSHVADAYKAVYAKRAEIRRIMDEWLKRSQYLGQLPLPDEADTKARLEEVERAIGAANQIRSAWDVHAKRVEERNRALATLHDWESRLAAIGEVETPDLQMLASLKESENELRATIEEASATAAGLERANAPILRMLEALDSQVCPLCDKLVCATDKTSCKSDLEESVRANRELAEAARLRLEEAKKHAANVSERIAAIEEARRVHDGKSQLESQISSLRASIPAVPAEPPAAPDVVALGEEAKKLHERIRQLNLYAECEKAGEEYLKTKEVYDLFCVLVKKCEPKKGLLTNSILEYVLKPFCDHVNGFLKNIAGDVEATFKMDDDGLQVYCRPHGRKSFVPVKALSTGEKLLVTFALMDMVSGISNSRIISFDCVEALDAGNLEALLKLMLLPETQARYDHILISVVDHASIRKIVERNSAGLNVVRF